jgi:orotidine-5'-phosphate decarboxylase
MNDSLVKYSKENKTILCFGIDPVIEKINNDGAGAEEKIMNYYFEITDALLAEHAISAIKPNYAYFAQYGMDGLSALGNVINRYKGKTYIILDGKRGDIGRSSDAYAREIYDFWGADATTVSPYMGSDSIKPFLKEGKTAYVLCRTSNEGAKDFQELKVGRKFLYEHIAMKAVEWSSANANCGLVVGATSDSIKRIVKITGGTVPFLIPGVGSQGGDLEMVMKAIKDNLYIHRINASSSIAFAYEKQGGSAKDAAVNEARKLNGEIRKYLQY